MLYLKPICKLSVDGSCIRLVNPIAIRFIRRDGVLCEEKAGERREIKVYNDGYSIAAYGEDRDDGPEYAIFVDNEDVLEVDLPPMPAFSLVPARSVNFIFVERKD